MPGLTKFLRIAAALSVAALGAAGGAGAAESAASAWTETEQTRLRLIAASTTTGAARELRLGLQFELQPGWKVYWRSPGDAGFPPQLDWTGSRNLAAADINWPAPERFSVLGLQTLGYKKQVVLPVTAKTVAADQGADLKARVRYLTCNDICIPYEAKLSLAVPAGPASPSPHAHLINRYQATVPGDGKAHGLAIEDLRSWSRGGTSGLTVLASADAPFQAPDAFMEGAPGLAFSKPSVAISDGGRRVRLDITVDGLDGLDDAKGKTLDARTFMVTLVDGNRAAEKSLDAKPGGAPAAAAPGPPRPGPALLTILLLAVLGGLILNMMPCVLPVLSIKLLSVVKHGGGDPAEVRAGFLASAAGIVAAFLGLAGALAALKAGGTLVGWGIQFQQPWFLISLVALVTVFACNLWGFFEVHLPQAVADAGIRAGHVHGLGGHFLQGAFATLLATPCSAPFLGTAVGFALASGTTEILAVFAALGVGLALPYLLIALAPSLATRLPRPGPWMVKLKVVLGVALAATGVWLLSVLAGVTGGTAALAVGALMAVLAIVLYAVHRPGGAGVKASMPALAAGLAAALALPTAFPAPANPAAQADRAGIWQPFDETAIPGLVAAGKTVFVDVTADWCITCIVNKNVVLADDRVLDLIQSGKVVAMQADWTRPDDGISRYLARYGRYGIPFNIVYGPEMPDGVVLPELLSAGAVLAAIGEAARPGTLTATR
ncbi:MAG: protein-disulfide reductase DsbD family protein [Magnetovibrio sp.]|nr:protein-disulfide reductase DsbD family protein [Magnetovibrio sp.]